MVRRGAAATHQCLPVRPADKTIEQTVAVDVAAFLSTEKETDSAQAMNPRPYSRQFRRGLFDGADGAQSRRMKKRRRAEQHRVENLGRAGNSRQPFQSANCKREDHEPPSRVGGIGARSATDGPFKTLPKASKREP